jgi:hypothetical protein
VQIPVRDEPALIVRNQPDLSAKQLFEQYTRLERCPRVAREPLGDLAAIRFGRLREHRKNPR